VFSTVFAIDNLIAGVFGKRPIEGALLVVLGSEDRVINSSSLERLKESPQFDLGCTGKARLEPPDLEFSID